MWIDIQPVLSYNLSWSTWEVAQLQKVSWSMQYKNTHRRIVFILCEEWQTFLRLTGFMLTRTRITTIEDWRLGSTGQTSFEGDTKETSITCYMNIIFITSVLSLSPSPLWKHRKAFAARVYWVGWIDLTFCTVFDSIFIRTHGLDDMKSILLQYIAAISVH